jgi:hypothetical protein
VYCDEWAPLAGREYNSFIASGIEASLEGRESQLFLHCLRTIILGRITHHFALIDWRLTISIHVRSAICGALPTTFHQDMSLQCIFSRKALLAMSAREWLHSQMDPLMSLQIVVTIEGLWTLVTFERSVILLLLLSWMVAVHLPTHLMWRILHVHSPHESHLISWAMHIGHDRPSHRRKSVAAIRWSGVVALWCCHRRMWLR